MVCNQAKKCWMVEAPKNEYGLIFTNVANKSNNYLHGGLDRHKNDAIIFCKSL